MRRYIMLDKKVGETPLAALSAWKAENPSYANMPASYAGRLDPMAEGKLLILLGEECKRQKDYTKLDKEYEIEVVLDLETDTGDVLGLPSYEGKETSIEPKTLARVLRQEEGAHMRAYPRYSSKTVDGKPLFLHALEGADVSAPEHLERIYSIRLLKAGVMDSDALRSRIFEKLAHAPRSDEPSKELGADFRQDEIRKVWSDIFATLKPRPFFVLRLQVACASGTYMRTLAGRIGEALGTKGLALSIRRTRIGRRVGPFWVRSL